MKAVFSSLLQLIRAAKFYSFLLILMLLSILKYDGFSSTLHVCSCLVVSLLMRKNQQSDLDTGVKT